MVAIEEQFDMGSRQMEQPRRRFSRSLFGYRRRAVDQHVADLELELSELDRELVELRSAASLREEVAHEMRRIGEETATVLTEAHRQRDSIVRAAEEEAHRLIVSATAKVRKLEAQREAAHQERDRLLENALAASTAIASVVRAAQQEVPAMTTPTVTDPIGESEHATDPDLTISDRRALTA